MSYQPKIALVHDDFIQAGGAESLFATVASLWPSAPIYTSLVDWRKFPATINPQRVQTSWMQKIPFATKFYKALLPLYPLAFESFNFDDFDVVISSTTRFAKSIITKPKTIHICYINSLPRFLWNESIQKEYLSQILRLTLIPFLHWLQKWDLVSSFRVDHYIANSQNIAANLKKHYGYDCKVIYPFADLKFFTPAKIHNWKLKSQNYFLIVSRLVKWKKIDIAIKTALALGINLKIVGIGPDERRLRKLAVSRQPSAVSGQIEFLARVTKEELRALYQNCQALIITSQEDFGISAVEAQACGRPVIAYESSGQKEIIKDGQTGFLFKSQTPQSLQGAIGRLSKVKWEVSTIRKDAQRFSQATFERELMMIVNSHIGN